MGSEATSSQFDVYMRLNCEQTVAARGVRFKT